MDMMTVGSNPMPSEGSVLASEEKLLGWEMEKIGSNGKGDSCTLGHLEEQSGFAAVCRHLSWTLHS